MMKDSYSNKIKEMVTSSDKISVQYTSFLSEEEQNKAELLLRNENIFYIFDGGIKNAQRKMLAVCKKENERLISFPFRLLQIKVSEFDMPLVHRDVLGSILGLGIKRNILGDIIIEKNCAYVPVEQNMVSFICNNLFRIGHRACVIEVLPEGSILSYEQKYSEQTVFIASNRLDCFVTSITNLSRQKSSIYIKAGNIYINGLEVTDVTKHLRAGDKLTIRGYGKYLLPNDPENCSIASRGKMRIMLKKYD